MRKHLLSLLLAITALLSGNVLAQDPPRVLLLGDSISLGYDQPTRDLLAGIASVHHPPENCQSTEYGLVKIEEWLGSTPWDVIHFNWGIWDAHHFTVDDSFRTTHAEYEQNLRTLVARLKTTEAQLIWASTTPLRGRIDVGSLWVEEAEIPIRNAIAYQVMVDNGIAINDLYAEMLPHLAQLQSADNVHYTSAGYDFLAQRVVDSIFSGEPVSDYVGMTQANAEAAVVVDGFTLGTVTTAYSETVATGLVISQNPLPGTLLTAPIDLVVSLGNARATVPDVVGEDQASAEGDVVAANLTASISYSFSETIPVGNVISQNPASGTDVLAGSLVAIEVSRGDLAMVQYWLLDDGSGTTAANHIPGGNTGTLVGTPTWITSGLPPNLPSTAALDVDSGDHLDGGNINLSSSSGGGEVTVSMWLNPDALDGDKRIIGQLSGATSQAGAVGIGQTAGAGGLWVWDGTGFGLLTNAGALSVGSWQHFSLVWNSGQVTAYLNGVAQLTATANFDFGAGNGNFGVAAKFVGTYGDGFDGQIDDVAIFDVALSSQEVLALYQQSPAPVISTLSPADDTTGVAVDSNLVVTFDREVALGSGNITLMRPSDFWEGGGDTVVETFDVTTSSRLQVSGTMVTIDPSSDLAESVGYYVLIDSTAIKDASDNFFAGTSGSGSWDFTTIITSITFAEWISGFEVGGLTDFNDDYDRDGLVNGFEAWLGTHPGQANGGLAALTTDGTATTFIHPQNANPPDEQTGFYQWSSNLVDWYAGDGIEGPAGGPTVTISPTTVGTTTTVTATASEAMEQLFLRAGILAPTSPSSAAVELTQVGATAEWDVNIAPITFTANSNPAVVEWLIIEDYFSAGSTANGTHVSGTLSVSVNGGAASSITPFTTTGTWGGAPFGPLDSNDLLINLFGSGLDPSDGDTVTVSGSLRFSSTDVPAPVAGPVNAALWHSSAGIQTDEVSVAVP
jgi:acyl-CoA thioesterase-1